MSQKRGGKRSRLEEDDNFGEGSSSQRSKMVVDSSQSEGTDWASEVKLTKVVKKKKKKKNLFYSFPR
jgi:hypothetical protein